MDLPQPSNTDIISRIDDIEEKVDRLCALVEQANGAWFFIKVLASFSLGLMTVWGVLYNWMAR